jgi:Na+-driven multidrug efflux pump
LGLGVAGAAYASTITALTNLIVIHFYVNYYLPEIKEAWFMPNKDSFNGLFHYIRFAFPAMLMLCIECWTFEILTLFSSWISVDAIGT